MSLITLICHTLIYRFMDRLLQKNAVCWLLGAHGYNCVIVACNAYAYTPKIYPEPYSQVHVSWIQNVAISNSGSRERVNAIPKATAALGCRS